jgi:hypothetical protein
MKSATDHKTTLHVWVLGAVAVLLSIASAFSYFEHIGQGIAIGDMLGSPGREAADIAIAQQRFTYWLIASLFCLGASIVTASLALPLYSDASRLPRYIARLVVATIFSVLLTVFIGVAASEIIPALHRVLNH